MRKLGFLALGLATALVNSAFASDIASAIKASDLAPFVAKVGRLDGNAPGVNPSEPAQVDAALAEFQAKYKDIAGLFSAEEFRTPGEQKFLDRTKWSDHDALVKLAAARKQLDQNQASNRNTYGLKAVLVSPNQVPRVYNLAKKAAAALELSDNFHIFIVGSNEVNAFTYSYNANDYDVVLYSPIVDLLDDEALQAVIGHEMGHVKDQVILYKVAMAADFEARNAATSSASHMPYYDAMFDELPPALRSRMQAAAQALVADHNNMGVALSDAENLEFSRDAELTADRAGVIATGNANGILKTMAGLIYQSKELLSEMNVKDLVEQVRAVLANTSDPSDIDNLVGIEGNHPFNVLRLVEASDFAKSKTFETVHGRLTENSFGKELDIFVRVVVKYAVAASDYKDYLEKDAETDETLVRLKTKDQYTKQLTRLGQGFNALGLQILGQVGESSLTTPNDALFDQFVTKIGDDKTEALKRFLAPALTDYVKKLADAATGPAADELKAKLKKLGDAAAPAKEESSAVAAN